MTGNYNNINSPESSSISANPEEHITLVSGNSELTDALSHLVVMGRAENSNAVKVFLLYAQKNNISLKHCWVTRNLQDNIISACLAIPNSGKTSMLFTSTPNSAPQVDSLARLITHVSTHLRSDRTAIAQALLTLEEQNILQAFQMAGYSKLANLSYLERRIYAQMKGPANLKWPLKITIETYNSTNEISFKDAITSSYEKTLDCPDLCGLRDINDVMDGHKGIGIFDPTLWYLVRYKKTPVAVLLLNKLNTGAPKDDVELSYIGIASKFRGLGIGRALLFHGLKQLSDNHKVQKITLAVDEDNKPALKLYKDFNFYRTDRRIALILPIK